MIFILAIQTAIADDTAVTEETPSVPPQATVVSSPDQAPDFSEVVQFNDFQQFAKFFAILCKIGIQLQLLDQVAIRRS